MTENFQIFRTKKLSSMFIKKGKVLPVTGDEDPEGEQRLIPCSYTLQFKLQ
jgi:hypothetical protein